MGSHATRTMAVELAPVGSSPLPHIYVPEGRTFTFGRSVQTDIAHQSISRRHCELYWAEKPELTVTALKKRLTVVQPGSDPVKVTPDSGSCQMQQGSELHFTKPAPGGEPLALVFRGVVAMHKGSPAKLTPASRQHAAHSTLASTHDITAASQDDVGLTPASKRRAGALHRCTAFFCDPSGSAESIARLQALGGTVAQDFGPHVTHVISPAGGAHSTQHAQGMLSALTQALQTRGSGSAPNTGEGDAADAIHGMHFVSVDWVAACAQQGSQHPEAPYATPAPRAALLQQLRTARSPQHTHAAPKASLALSAVASGDWQAAVVGDSAGASAGASAAPEATIPGWGMQRWGRVGWTAQDWGAGGVWLEPYDVVSVKETLEALFTHYHRMDTKGEETGEEGGRSQRLQPHFTGVQEPGGTSFAAAQHSEAEPATGAVSPVDAEACAHAACSAVPVCFVQQLQETLKGYVRGRGADSFRLFGTRRAITALESATTPIRSAADVDNLHLGAKSAAKVKEILEDGFLTRNVNFSQNPEAQAEALFCSVWGIGPSHAQHFVRCGLRTLADLRANPDCLAMLSVRERAGLKYAEDFAVRIPREEAKAAQDAVAEVVTRQLAAVAEVSPARAAQQLHCRALGSFCRGKVETGDVDMMVVPGDHLGHVCSWKLLAAVMYELRQRDMATADIPLPSHPDGPCCDGCMEYAGHSATWLGACYVPGFAHVARRLDVKIYPACMRACAVNYFTGSGLFNRMLRYWCDRPTSAVAARAAAHVPGGAVFHLSDRQLVVRPLPNADMTALAQGGTGGGARRGATATALSQGLRSKRSSAAAVPPREHVVSVWCESDIFQAVGLAYVPPHMRHFHGVGS
eukprot:jgi/Ulvmu1/6066/UM027_0044.1